MRSAIFLSCFAVVFAITAPSRSAADEPTKNSTLPCTIDKLEKDWNLKLKSMVIKESGAEVVRHDLVLTIEFTKDATNVKAIRTAFTSPVQMNGPRQPYVQVYFFDEDNVVLFKQPIGSIQGEITGKMSDAFRVVMHISPNGPNARDALKQTKKIELRMSEKE